MSCEAGGRAFADEVGFALGKELYADRAGSESPPVGIPADLRSISWLMAVAVVVGTPEV